MAAEPALKWDDYDYSIPTREVSFPPFQRKEEVVLPEPRVEEEVVLDDELAPPPVDIPPTEENDSIITDDPSMLINNSPIPQTETPLEEETDGYGWNGNLITGEKEDWKLSLPHILLPHQPGLDLSTGGNTPETGFNESGVRIGWDDVKNTLQNLSGGANIAGTVTLGGIQTDDFNPEATNPTYSTGKEMVLPDSGTATSTTGPTQKLFNDIMAGKVKGGANGISSGNNGGGMIKPGHHSSLKSNIKKPKSGGDNGSILPKLNRIRGNGVSKGKSEAQLERVQDAIMHRYSQWPIDSEGAHVYHKGAITLFVEEFGISIKYGSYRKTLLETFAKAHPDAMPKVAEMLGI